MVAGEVRLRSKKEGGYMIVAENNLSLEVTAINLSKINTKCSLLKPQGSINLCT